MVGENAGSLKPSKGATPNCATVRGYSALLHSHGKRETKPHLRTSLLGSKNY